MATTLDGTETLQVLGTQANGQPAATTMTVTTQDIANISAGVGLTSLVLDGATSGSTTITPAAVASGTLTLPAATTTLVGRTTTDTLTNKTLTTPVITSISNGGTITIPSGTDTLVGRATTDTLTNKTLTSPVVNGATLSIAASRSGTVTLNGVTPVTVANANITANSVVIFTLKTVGGTVGAYPSIKTITVSTGFDVAGTASDTSVYNYAIIS